MSVEQIIIEAVSHYPYLWSIKDPVYRDQKAKDAAWTEVASRAGVTVDECKTKWKYLRDRYVRELKKTKFKRSEDEEGAVQSTWALFELMSFLESSVRHRR